MLHKSVFIVWKVFKMTKEFGYMRFVIVLQYTGKRSAASLKSQARKICLDNPFKWVEYLSDAPEHEPVLKLLKKPEAKNSNLGQIAEIDGEKVGGPAKVVRR